MRRILAVRVAIVSAVVVGLAQVVGLGVRALPMCGLTVPVTRCNFLNWGPLILTRRQNPGILTQLFQSTTTAAGLALLGCVLILLYALWLGRANWFVAIAVGLQAGGALSNLFDRLVFGVTNDYVVLGRLLIINLADLCIMVGSVLAIAAILYSLVAGDGRRRAPSGAPQATG